MARRGIGIVAPLPYAVYQRRGYDPLRAHPNNPGGPRAGSALVRLSFRDDSPGGRSHCIRLQGAEWSPVEPTPREGLLSVDLEVPAGGWYRAEVGAVGPGGEVVERAETGPFGVGEVYVIAGQSYAGNWNDVQLKVEDPLGRVAALDPRGGGWRVAHDPQPLVAEDTGALGSIWPEAMGLLGSVAGVPIGMANVSVGATASRQWLPGTPLFANLERICRALGDFRAVLWQQGESDVIEGARAAEYVQRVAAIKGELNRRLGLSRPWLPAKSTLHPTVYSNPEGEQEIRSAIDTLWAQEGFRPGPDTDVLGGGNRSGPEGSRHFSLAGQRHAGLLWFAALWRELNERGPA